MSDDNLIEMKDDPIEPEELSIKKVRKLNTEVHEISEQENANQPPENKCN